MKTDVKAPETCTETPDMQNVSSFGKSFSGFVAAELDILLYWIRERESVRQAKEAGRPKPWTADPLLRNYRWCNVRRLDDRVSRALFDRWYDPAGNRQTMLAAAVLARLVNWPDSLLEVSAGKPFRLEHLEDATEVLRARASRPAKVFTGAYLIPPPPREDGAHDKIEHVVGFAELIGNDSYRTIAPTMRATWQQITRWDGIGSFLGGQIVADLAHLSVGSSWPDRDVWAPVGPGSARGINRLLGRPKDKAVAQAEFETLLPRLAAVVRPEIAGIWADRQLQAMDLQNCLCEFDKYRRLTLGEGKVRARYNGTAESATLL